MSSPDAVHFSIENFNEDFNMLTIIPRSNILELNFVHPEGHKTMCFEWIGRSWIFTLCENKSVRLMWNNPCTSESNNISSFPPPNTHHPISRPRKMLNLAEYGSNFQQEKLNFPNFLCTSSFWKAKFPSKWQNFLGMMRFPQFPTFSRQAHIPYIQNKWQTIEFPWSGCLGVWRIPPGRPGAWSLRCMPDTSSGIKPHYLRLRGTCCHVKAAIHKWIILKSHIIRQTHTPPHTHTQKKKNKQKQNKTKQNKKDKTKRKEKKQTKKQTNKQIKTKPKKIQKTATTTDRPTLQLLGQLVKIWFLVPIICTTYLFTWLQSGTGESGWEIPWQLLPAWPSCIFRQPDSHLQGWRNKLFADRVHVSSHWILVQTLAHTPFLKYATGIVLWLYFGQWFIQKM